MNITAPALPASLPFYPGCTVEPYDTGAGLALRWKDRLYVLRWTNEAPYQLNDDGALHLTRHTVAAYAKWFFSVTRGQKGCFFIVEPDDPLPWQPWANASDKEAVRNLLRPLTFMGIDDEGLYRLSGTVVFTNYETCALFHSDVRIAPRQMPVYDPEHDCMEEFCLGQLRLADDEMLLECIAVAPPERPPDTSSRISATNSPDFWMLSDDDAGDIPF